MNDPLIVSGLKASSLFQNLSEERISRIATNFQLKRYLPEEIIFEDGSEVVDGLYVIAGGSIKIYKRLGQENSKNQAVAVLQAGNFFGEMALLDEDQRSAGAMSIDNSELLFLSKDSFNELMSQDMDLAHELISRIAKVMSRRLRDTNNLFREVVSWSYRARQEVKDLKSNFLSTISHELRTPIHSIQGFTTLMKDSGEEVDEDTRKRFIDVILQESKRLSDLINDLIALAEMEYGAIVLNIKQIPLGDLVEKAFEDHRLAAQEKRIECHLLIPANLPPVNVDGGRLGQAVEHLIENAVKFTPYDGRVSVEVAQTKASVDILVTDSGNGIPSKLQDKIFDKFYQIDQSTTRAFEGAGIGLSLARHIVELHGGHIAVQSAQEKGATFKISLPKKHILPSSE